jgi:uncharacterized protein YbjT (DUF2867 family)
VITLVVGATGSLGGRVVDALVARGHSVRALVRPGTHPGRLATKGAEIVRGDLLDPPSLDQALDGAAALVTTAAGYMRRRKGDSLAKVDGLGNRNLVDAARRAGLGRFVFTSVLAADRARDVPHFWQKKLTEDYLEQSGVPFVALRPGAFMGAVGEGRDFWARGIAERRISTIGSPTARWTYIHIDDVARALALAVDEPRAAGRRVDLGMDRPLSAEDVAAEFSKLLGETIRVRRLPWALLSFGARMAGLFNPLIRDFRAMLAFFFTGAYVADTTAQAELFGPVPTVEDSLRRYVVQLGLTPR